MCEIVFIKAAMYITICIFMILPGLGMSVALLCIQLVQTVRQIRSKWITHKDIYVFKVFSTMQDIFSVFFALQDVEIVSAHKYM